MRTVLFSAVLPVLAVLSCCAGGGVAWGAEPMKIKITANGNEMTMTLAENSSARALLEMVLEGDVTVRMQDYANMEKTGALPRSLPRNDTPMNTTAGDVILYQGNQLGVYYGPNSWPLTPIGKIEGATKQKLLAILGPDDVTVILSAH